MKNASFWDVTPRDSCKNRRFGGTYHPVDGGDTLLRHVGSNKSRKTSHPRRRLHLQGENNEQTKTR
jgi:hypothetical protein